VDTDKDSRKAKKQSTDRQEVTSSGRVKAASADESSILKRAPTRGHRKSMQRLEDLWQNEAFLTELAAIQATPDWRKRSTRLFKFAEENSLEFFVGSPLSDFLVDKKRFLQDPIVDVCQIVDRVDEMFGFCNYEDYATPPKPLPDRKLSIMLYPINVCISPLASKRDVLDYVMKRWDEIRNLLDIYWENPPRIRARQKADRDRFIWAHRDVPSEELAHLVDKEFPGGLLTYADINSIKQKLRKRYSDK
jgi:hypothetical protein